LKRFLEYFDKVGREKTNGTRVPSQATHPPLSIASIERLDQIALDEAQVLLRFTAP
jgi:hypothetical protein